MKLIEYNKNLNEIEGFENLETLGRTNKLGSQALVFIVRDIYVVFQDLNVSTVIFLTVVV